CLAYKLAELPVRSPGCSVADRARPQDEIERRRIGPRMMELPPPFEQGDVGRECPRDPTRDRVLKFENIGKLAIVAIAPHNCTRPRVRQLCSDAHPVSGVPDATCDEIVGAKVRRDFFLGRWAFLIARYGVPPDHAHRIEATECIDDLVSYTLGEIVLAIVAGLVGEGQHRDDEDHAGRGRLRWLGESRNASWLAQLPLLPSRAPTIAVPVEEAAAYQPRPARMARCDTPASGSQCS